LIHPSDVNVFNPGQLYRKFSGHCGCWKIGDNIVQKIIRVEKKKNYFLGKTSGVVLNKKKIERKKEDLRSAVATIV